MNKSTSRCTSHGLVYRTLPLRITSCAPAFKRTQRGDVLVPVNVDKGGVCRTINTQFEWLTVPEHIIRHAHFPRSAVFIERFA